MSVRIFGIRHHGPGSAQSLLAALEEWRPDAVLIEGPPEADDLISLASHIAMQPPVALLVYVPDEPRRAVYYPFARFSPEWQAIRWAHAAEVPCRFIDLPQAHWMALDEEVRRPLRGDTIAKLAEAGGYTDAERWCEHMVEQ